MRYEVYTINGLRGVPSIPERERVSKVNYYDFYFSPEGRHVDTVTASSVKQAKAIFYKTNSRYRKAKGEIYYQLRPIDCVRCGQDTGRKPPSLDSSESENVDDAIKANEYTFTAEGKRED